MGRCCDLRFGANGLTIVAPGHGATLTGKGPLVVAWQMRAGLEKGSWEISNALLGDAPQPAHSELFLLAPNIVLQVPSTNATAQPGHGELVLEARGDSPQARVALSELCAAYWKPVFHFLRREGAVKVAIHRLRKRFRDLVRFEVAQTVPVDSEISAEIRYLVEALSSSSR